MGEAIETTQLLYPTLLDAKPDLLFMLKCRQFVEMVNGTDSEVQGSVSSCTFVGVSGGYPLSGGGGSHGRSPKSYRSNDGSNRSSPAHSPHSYVHAGTPPQQHPQQQNYYHFSQQQQQQQTFHQQHHHTPDGPLCNSPSRLSGKSQGHQSPASQSLTYQQQQHHNNSYNNASDGSQNNNPMNYGHIVEEEALMNSANVVVSRDHITMNGGPVGPRLIEGDEMDLCDEVDHSSTLSNGNSQFNGTSAHSEQMGRLLCLFHKTYQCTIVTHRRHDQHNAGHA